MKDILNQIPAQEGIRTILPGDGRRFDLGPVHLRWKVRGEDSAYTYTMFELSLTPGGGVDLHSHPSPETFYVLEGEITFFRITEGQQQAVVCGPGTTVMIPPNALHALYNKSENDCRLLDVSTGAHQGFFDAVGNAAQVEHFASMDPKLVAKRVSDIAWSNEMYLAPYDVNAGREVDL